MSSFSLSPLLKKSGSSDSRSTRKSSLEVLNTTQFFNGCSLEVKIAGYKQSHFGGNLHITSDLSSLPGVLMKYKLIHTLEIDLDSLKKHHGATAERVRINSTHLRKIAKALKSSKNLKRITLKGLKVENILGQKIFFEALSRLTNLRGLDLQMQGLDLLKASKFLKNLKFLNQVFFKAPSMESDMRRITSKLRYCRELKSTSIDFSQYPQTSPKQIEALSTYLGRCRDLKALDLNLTGCNRVPSDMECFSKLFQKLNLHSLSLNMSDALCLNDVTLRNLSNYLRRLKKVNKLSLNFERCFKIREAGIREVISSLKNLTQLKDLSIMIEGDPLSTDQTMGSKCLKELCIPQDFCGLTTYSLKFSGFQNVFDSAFKEYANSLSSLSRIRSLSLNFEGCPKISDQAVKDLASNLKEMKVLNSLALNFSRCRRITDMSLLDLSATVSELQLLKKIDMNFGISWSQNNNITDLGVINLSKAIKNLGMLRELLLNFKCCFSLTDNAMKDLISAYEPLNLSYLNLNLTNCSSISEDCKQLLEDSILNQSQSVLIF